MHNRFGNAVEFLRYGHKETTFQPPELFDYVDVQWFVTKNGTAFKCSHLPSDSLREPVYIIGGLRSEARFNPHLFEIARQAGIPLVFIELPKSEKPTGFMPQVEDVIQHVLLVDTPFIEKYRGQNINLLGHSTGAAGIVKYLWQSESQATEILSKFSEIRTMSTFLKASFEASVWQRHVYPRYARNHPDAVYGDTWQDRGHGALQSLFGAEAHGPKYTRLHHSEILYMAGWARETLEELQSKPCPIAVQRSRQIEFWHGANDGASDLHTVFKIAARISADVTVLRHTGHYMYSPERMAALLYHFYNNGTAIKQPLSLRLPRLGKPSLSFRMPALGSHLTSRMISERTGLTQTPHHEPPLPQLIPIGK